MGFRVGSYAKVWEVKPSEKGFASTSLRISISRKDKKTDQFVDDFSGFVTCYGTAHEKAATLVSGSKIKLLAVDVTKTYNKETQISYTNFKVFDWEPAEPYTNSGNGGADYEGGTGEPAGEAKPEGGYPWD